MDKKIKDYKTSNIQTRMSPGGYQELKKGGKVKKKKRGAAIKGRSKILR